MDLGKWFRDIVVLSHFVIGVLSSVIFPACGFAAGGEPSVQRGKSEGAPTFLAASLRPGAGGLAYVIGPDHTDATAGPVKLFYKDLATGIITIVKEGANSGADVVGSKIAPTWSPDGKTLAYRYLEQGAWRIHFWHPANGSVERVLSEPCAREPNDCPGDLRWAPDSRTLYFVSDAPDVNEGFAAHERFLVGPLNADGESNCKKSGAGVTVYNSNDSKVSAGSATSTYYLPVARAMVADAQTGALTLLVSLPGLFRVQLAPNGKQLLVGVNRGIHGDVRQVFTDWYILATDQLVRNEKSSMDTVPTPVLSMTKFWFGDWAPDSSSIAFVEQGVEAVGDVFVLALSSKSLSNLTAGPLHREKGELELSPTRSLWNDGIPRGKFAGQRLVWSPRGDAIYVLRRTALATGWRTRLWSVGFRGDPTNLSAGASYDADLPFFVLPTVAVVPIREPDGQSALSEMRLGASMLGRQTAIRGEIFDRFGLMVTPDKLSGELAFVAQSDTSPPEAFIFNGQRRAVDQVTRVNKKSVGASELPTAKRVDWSSASGPHYGVLYSLPGASRLAPLIVQVYPREMSSKSVDIMDYPLRTGKFLPGVSSLLAGGFSIFLPDLPVVGGGNTCSDIAASIDSALRTIRTSRLADVDRSAIIGASFGGWAVNCVITKTHQFRAAISVAGVSDLISGTFSFNPGAHSWAVGGGQTDIDQTIWEAPMLYWQESPVSGVQNVTTPLLLISGAVDSTVPSTQSTEMYSALSSLGKPVTLAIYDGANHDTVLSRPDFVPRMESWLKGYLGAP